MVNSELRNLLPLIDALAGAGVKPYAVTIEAETDHYGETTEVRAIFTFADRSSVTLDEFNNVEFRAGGELADKAGDVIDRTIALENKREKVREAEAALREAEVRLEAARRQVQEEV